MAQIELPNGIKITLTSKEVLEVLSDFNAPSSSPQEKETGLQVRSRLVSISSDKPAMKPMDFPEISDIVKSLEDKGRPFTHTIYEEFVNRFQKYPRQDGKLYRKFRGTLKSAQKQLASRYKGHWETKKFSIDGKPSAQFWLVSDENVKESNIQNLITDINQD